MSSELESLEVRTCDNCNVEVVGRFCPLCGQNDKNYESSLWRVIGDILREQFDFHSRATRTLKTLVLRPGLLSVEFRANRRASYVAPIRMYLFSSLLFFFLIALSPSDRSDRNDGVFSFSLGTDSYSLQFDSSDTEELGSPTEITEEENGLEFQETQSGSIDFSKETELARQHLDETTNQLISEILIRPEDSRSRQYLLAHLMGLSDRLKRSMEAGDSLGGFDLWFAPFLVKMLHDTGRLIEDFKNNLALIMVILLPWMVLTSALLNVGKHVRLVHQLVFWMHFFTFAFLILSLELLVVRFAFPDFGWTGYVSLAIYLVLLVHSYMAYQRFYGRGHLSSTFKFLLLLFFYSIALFVALLAVVALSIYNL